MAGSRHILPDILTHHPEGISAFLSEHARSDPYHVEITLTHQPERSMDRKEFLASLGISAVFIAMSTCVDGCNVANPVSTAPTNVDFTLDLTAPANSALKNNGGYVYSNDIIVARTIAGEYVAVYSVCPHAGSTVFYDPRNNRFDCPAHGSNFATNGTLINGPANTGLTRYNTSLNGTSLRVYS
jgi:cytochrome b6-f complex iron-sulfur subunit